MAKVDRSLARHIAGWSEEHIREMWLREYNGDFGQYISGVRAQFESDVLEAVMQRALDGDVAAVEWLERKHLLFTLGKLNIA